MDAKTLEEAERVCAELPSFDQIANHGHLPKKYLPLVANIIHHDFPLALAEIRRLQQIANELQDTNLGLANTAIEQRQRAEKAEAEVDMRNTEILRLQSELDAKDFK